MIDTLLRRRGRDGRRVRGSHAASSRSFHIHRLAVETHLLKVSLSRAYRTVVAQGVILHIPAVHAASAPARRRAVWQVLGLTRVRKRGADPGSGGDPKAAKRTMGGETESKQGRGALALKLWQVNAQQHGSKRAAGSRGLQRLAGPAQAGCGSKDDWLSKDLQEAREPILDRTVAQQRPKGTGRLEHGGESAARDATKKPRACSTQAHEPDHQHAHQLPGTPSNSATRHQPEVEAQADAVEDEVRPAALPNGPRGGAHPATMGTAGQGSARAQVEEVEKGGLGRLGWAGLSLKRPLGPKGPPSVARKGPHHICRACGNPDVNNPNSFLPHLPYMQNV